MSSSIDSYFFSQTFFVATTGTWSKRKIEKGKSKKAIDFLDLPFFKSFFFSIELPFWVGHFLASCLSGKDGCFLALKRADWYDLAGS